MITINGKSFRNFAEQIIENRENDERVNEIAAEMEENVQELTTKVQELTNSIAEMQQSALQGLSFNIHLQNSEDDESEYWGVAYVPAGNTNLDLPNTIVAHGTNTNVILTATDGMNVGNTVINQLDYERYLITELSINRINMPTVE